MSTFHITGLGGKRELSGSIKVRGAKNAALKALAASILFDDGIVLTNIPAIEDVKRTNDILSRLGISVDNKTDGECTLRTPATLKTDLPADIAKKLRASIVFLGPLLSRFGSVSFPHPGGCVIGERPIDLFIEGFKKMGAQYSHRGERYVLKAPQGGLHGAMIVFKKPSVTATETLMMAAVRAHGKTVLKNTAQEPEIVVLAEFLNRCGAQISGAGTSTIEIVGSKALHSGKEVYQTPPDRIETGSFLILGALAARDLKIQDCNPAHIEILTEMLRGAGANITVEKKSILIHHSAPTQFKPIDIETREYPGFPTDLQAQMMALLCTARGISTITEKIYPERFMHIGELNRMGAQISLEGVSAIIKGVRNLSGAEVMASDLRASAALVIGGLVAKGKTEISRIYHLDRGYRNMELKLTKLGARIRRIKE